LWMSHVSFVNESCLFCEWVMSLLWMSHVSFVNESCLFCEWRLSCEWVMSLLWMSHVSHVNMRWLQLVGSLKTPVSFAKEPYKRDLYSAKETYFLRSLLIIATPYECHVSRVNKSCLSCEWVMSLISTSHVTGAGNPRVAEARKRTSQGPRCIS